MLTAKEEVKSELSQRRPQPTGIDATYYDLGYGSLTLTRLDPSPLAEQLADVLAKRGQSLRLDSGAHLAVCYRFKTQQVSPLPNSSESRMAPDRPSSLLQASAFLADGPPCHGLWM